MIRLITLILFSVSLFAGVQPCPNRADYADGVRLKWGDQYFYHSGQNLAWNSAVYYPDGHPFVWANVVQYPNGQTLMRGQFIYYPNGQILRQWDSTYYPSGRHLVWSNNVYYENGNPARFANRFYLPNGALTQGPLLLRASMAPYGDLAAYIFEYNEVLRLQLTNLFGDPRVRVKHIEIEPNFSFEIGIDTGHPGLQMVLTGDLGGIRFCDMRIE